MTKHVVDTDIYVDLIRTGAPHAYLAELYERETPGIHFSSVVIEELLAGAYDKDGRQAVEMLFRPFERAGRIITPSHAVWKDVGRFLAWVRDEHPTLRSKARALANDALIALSARSIGATVHTSNCDDFQLVSRWRPLALRLAP